MTTLNQCTQCGTPLQEGVKFCPQCGISVSAAAVESGPTPQTPVSKKKWVIAGVLSLVLIGGLSAYFKVLLRQFHPVIENQPSVVVPIEYGMTQRFA
ncbi:MAG: zinc-ribbon domain-containing protein, partial [Ignavibacteriales bacterium]|nr:zinc-ribbon domain-containing protein [Ignavibacteriales bacterium]